MFASRHPGAPALLAFLAVAVPVGARSADLYAGLPPAELPADEGVAGTIFDSFQRETLGTIGPLDASLDIELLATADVSDAVAGDEVVAWDGSALRVYRAATNEWLDDVSVPAPPEGLTALTGADLVGSSRRDLVAAVGPELYVLDADVESPTWASLGTQPFSIDHLAAMDLGGATARAELIAVAAGSASFLDLDAGADARGTGWQPLLPAPPFALDALYVVDVRNASGDGSEPRLVATSGRDLHARFEGAWVGPFPQRFAIRAFASIELFDRVAGAPGVVDTEEALLVLEEEPASGLVFSDETVAAGLASYSDPGGNRRCPGAIFADIDGDGYDDLYLVRDGDNDLFLGDGVGFTKAPGALGALAPGDAAGAVLADYDNDGDRDLFVANPTGPDTLFQQQPDGSFVDVTASTDPTPADGPGDDQEGLARGVMLDGCGVPPGPCSLELSFGPAWGDVNRDGHLDLFVAHHITHEEGYGERDVLYLAQGDGTFVDITAASGIRSGFPPRSSLASMFADLNDDGWPDLFVANKPDGERGDELYLNDGDADGNGVWDGTFTEVLDSAGLPADPTDEGVAMGMDVGDADGDGDLDVFVTDMGRSDLYRNRLAEDGDFALVRATGDDAPLPASFWSRGAAWFDADNDGDLDLYVATESGNGDYLYRNDGAGSFTDVARASGLRNAWQSRAALVADYDRDGWVDVFTVNRDGLPAALHRNGGSALAERHWLELDLEGDPTLPGPLRSSRDAIGARVELVAAPGGGAPTTQVRELRSGGHICASTSSLVVSFGLGSDPLAEVLVVRWPSGRRSTLGGVAADRRLSLSERTIRSDGFESGTATAWDVVVP